MADRRPPHHTAARFYRLRDALSDPLRQLQISLGLLVGLVAVGTAGYMTISGLGFVDALYMTVITLATVGFREVTELTTEGKIFTILLIVGGVTIAAWAISNAAEVMLGQTFWLTVQRRRVRNAIMDQSDHYVVCGYGRLGRQIVRDLEVRGEAYLIVDKDEGLERELLAAERPHLIGDATVEETLRAAGIDRARGFVSALDSDADNVLAVLTARELNGDILIVARASAETLESKLRRAGADRVVTPAAIGGHRLALALLRPTVDDFFSRVFTFGADPEIDVGQIRIPNGSALAGQTIAHCDLRQEHNISILAVRAGSGDFDLTPEPDRTIAAGDTLIVIGPAAAVYTLEASFSG